jgi:hypothetical protein
MRKTALKKRRWRTFAITGLEISYDFCGFLKNSPNKKREKDYGVRNARRGTGNLEYDSLRIGCRLNYRLYSMLVK